MQLKFAGTVNMRGVNVKGKISSVENLMKADRTELVSCGCENGLLFY